MRRLSGFSFLLAKLNLLWTLLIELAILAETIYYREEIYANFIANISAMKAGK